MNLTNNKSKHHPINAKLAKEYQSLIENDLGKFLEMIDNAQVDVDSLTPQQHKIVNKYRSKLMRKSTISTTKALWQYMMMYKPSVIFVLLVTLLSVTFNCLAAFALVYLTNALGKIQIDLKPMGQLTNPTDSSWFGTFSAVAGVILAFYFVFAFGMWAQTRVMAIVSQKVGYKIREDLFNKIQKLPVKYFDQNSSGDLMSKFTNDINNITDMFSQNSAVVLNGVVTIVAMLISMFLLSPYLTLILLAFLPFMIIPAYVLSKRSQPLFSRAQRTLGEVNGYIEEMISGQSVITLYDQNENVVESFNKYNKKLVTMTFKGQGVTSVILPHFIMYLNLTNAIMWVIGIVFSINKVGVGFHGIDLVNIANLMSAPTGGSAALDADALAIISGVSLTAAFSMMARNFLLPFTQIGGIANMFMMALAGADRALKVFNEVEEINECERLILNISELMLDNTSVPSLQEEESIKVEIDGKLQKINDLPHTVETNSSIKVKDLNFGYYDYKQILFDVNIDVKKGQTIAIVGPTGSGKSTFINLLTKFYDIKTGDILFGNRISIKDITKESIRNNVSIVLQDTFLFNESIKDNIRYGNMDASDEQIIKAAKTANAHNFIMQLPNGYDTILNDNGEDLSHGQRQLLAIARAILSPSNLLILDEATSSIDTKTEAEIQSAMMRLMENKTSFVIAHRLSTIQNADQILVIKDGHIIERGTHAELLEYKGFYYSLYNSQFYEEE